MPRRYDSRLVGGLFPTLLLVSSCWPVGHAFAEDVGALTLQLPAPAPLARNVGGRLGLAWSVGAGRLVPNGSFEEGTNGWNFVPTRAPGTLAISSNANSGQGLLPPVDGTNTLRCAPGQLTLELVIPDLDSAVGLGLSYAETGGLGLSSRLQFAPVDGDQIPVEIAPGLEQSRQSLSSRAWRRRGADLTRFAGRRGRLIWTLPDGDSVPWFLDDVRFVTVPEGQAFDVWFSRNASLPLEWLGRTRQPYWPLVDLDPASTCRWRIDTVTSAGIAEGAVWEFATAKPGLETRFSFDLVPDSVCAGQPVAFALRRRDELEFLRPIFSTRLSVRAITTESVPPSVRITEVDTAARDGIEFGNLSSEPVEVSNWRVEIFGQSDRLVGRTILQIPINSVVAPGELFTLQEARPVGSPWPNLRLPGIDWFDGASQTAALLLRDADNRIVDAFFAESTVGVIRGTTEPRQTSSVGPDQWQGLPLTNPPSAALTFQRRGPRDSNTSADWLLAPSTFGRTNLDLTVPARPGAGEVPIEFASTNRIYSSSRDARAWFALRFLSPTKNTRLVVQATQDGTDPLTLFSPEFAVESSSCLELTIPANLPENATNTTGNGLLRLPSPALVDTLVHLAIQPTRAIPTPAALGLPRDVLIPAGATEARFDLPHPDDDLLTEPWDYLVIATAAGYASTSQPLRWEDDDVATLAIEAPSTLVEGQGVNGKIRLDRPVGPGGLFVHLNAEPSGIVFPPGAAYIQEGAREGDFSLLAYENNSINGPSAFTLTASYADWIPVSVGMERLDNDTRTFELSAGANGTAIEGGILSLHVVLGGTLATPLTVSFSTSDPGALRAPEPVVLEPGNSILDVVFEAPDDALQTGSRSVLIHVTAPDFAEATIAITVQDTDPARLRVDLPPGPYAPGQSVEARVFAETLDGRLLPNAALGELTVRLVGASPGVALTTTTAVPGVSYTTLPFSLSGTGTGFHLEVGNGSLAGTSPSFSVWEAGPLTGVRHAIYDARRDQFLVVPGNPDGALQFVSGSDGSRTDLVASPIGIVDMAPTSDGDHLAVIDLAGARLATIDLAARSLSSEVRFGNLTPQSPWVGRSLVAAPGLSNAVVVARWHGTNDGLGGDLSLYVGDVRRTSAEPFPFLPAFALLASDPSEATVSLLQGTSLLSFPVTREGVGPARHPGTFTSCGVPSDPFPGPVLIRSDGVVVNPCLELLDARLPGHVPQPSPAQEIVARAVDPVTGRFATLRPNFGGGNALAVYTPHAPQLLLETALVPPLDFPARLGWAGSNRWFTISGGRLSLFSTPEPVAPGAADIAVTLTQVASDPDQGTAEVMIRVENLGPEPAPHVAALFAFGRSPNTSLGKVTPASAIGSALGLNNDLYALGTIRAGATVVLNATLSGAHDESAGPEWLGHLAASVRISSLLADPVPTNNYAEIRLDGLLPGPVPFLAISLTNAPVPSSSPPEILLTYPSVRNHRYLFETRTETAEAWQPEEGQMVGTGEEVRSRRTLPGPPINAQFWRLRRLSPGF